MSAFLISPAIRRIDQRGQRYVTLHPGSPDAAYAQYLIGESYLNQIDINRDQARTRKRSAR